MHWNNVIDRFDFDDQAIIDDDIDLITIFQLSALVPDRMLQLPDMRYASVAKFKAQAFFIHAFQKSRARLATDLDGEANHMP